MTPPCGADACRASRSRNGGDEGTGREDQIRRTSGGVRAGRSAKNAASRAPRIVGSGGVASEIARATTGAGWGTAPRTASEAQELTLPIDAVPFGSQQLC